MNDMSHSEPRCQSLVEDRICRILSPSAFGVRGLRNPRAPIWDLGFFPLR